MAPAVTHQSEGVHKELVADGCVVGDAQLLSARRNRLHATILTSEYPETGSSMLQRGESKPREHLQLL